MKVYWPDFAYELYERACRELNYPEVPFVKYIREVVEAEDVVADIGCGIGIPAMYVSSLCKRVVAVDCNKSALDYFGRSMEKHGIGNVDIVHGTWPEMEIEPCDVTMAFYAGKITGSRESLTALLNSTRRAGIIACNGTAAEGGFYKSLADELGVGPRKQGCDNGCYLRGAMEMAGCRVKCEQVAHEFGQPVEDMDEAAKFLCWQLQLDDSYLQLVREIADKYVTSRDGKMYIPNLRSTCVITFLK
jgi:hypothetical protein